MSLNLKWHLKMKWRICHHGCQMAIAKFSDCRPFGLEGLWLRYTTLQNLPSTLAQSKERKGSKFAIWQHCMSWRELRGHPGAMELRRGRKTSLRLQLLRLDDRGRLRRQRPLIRGVEAVRGKWPARLMRSSGRPRRRHCRY